MAEEHFQTGLTDTMGRTVLFLSTAVVLWNTQAKLPEADASKEAEEKHTDAHPEWFYDHYAENHGKQKLI